MYNESINVLFCHVTFFIVSDKVYMLINFNMQLETGDYCLPTSQSPGHSKTVFTTSQTEIKRSLLALGFVGFSMLSSTF